MSVKQQQTATPFHHGSLLKCYGVCFINVYGHPGKSIPADLHMEHLNRLVKEAIRN
jgi:hypothetical protein